METIQKSMQVKNSKVYISIKLNTWFRLYPKILDKHQSSINLTTQ